MYGVEAFESVQPHGKGLQTVYKGQKWQLLDEWHLGAQNKIGLCSKTILDIPVLVSPTPVCRGKFTFLLLLAIAIYASKDHISTFGHSAMLGAHVELPIYYDP